MTVASESPLRLQLGAWNDLGRFAGPLRMAVFVREQGVPPALEMDELDPLCLHVVAFDASGQAVATGRLLKDQDTPGAARVGRMAVARAVRGQGVGRQVLDALVAAARQRGDTQVVLSAQLHARAFYAQAGFEAEGEVYDDAGIPHITMRKHLST